MSQQFTFRVLASQDWDLYDDNIDVEIELNTGETFSATFFTVRNIQSLLNKFKATGECASGTYFWAVDMIITEDLSKETLYRAIEDLVISGDLGSACQGLDR